MTLALEVIVEIINILISMFLVLVAYHFFTESRNQGYRIEFSYFLVAAAGFMFFDLLYLYSGEPDIITSLRYFVKSCFLALILFFFLVKTHFLYPRNQKPVRKPRSLVKK